MRKEISTQINIDATPQKVWKVLTDFEAYPSWNPFILAVKGNIAEKSRIEINVKPKDSKAMVFKPTVLKVSPNRELRWLGSLMVKGLFDGEHRFELQDNGDGTTTFIHSENFSGIFIRFFDTEKTKAGFEMMNQRLKELAENQG